MIEIDPNIQGPVLDALRAIKDLIWWDGFKWGALAGFVLGTFFTLMARWSTRE